MTTHTTCHACGHHVSDYRRADICPGCRRDTRVCRNCDHYAQGMNNDCREPQADRVLEKDKSNFCDYFRPGRPGGAGQDAAAKARAAAEVLFKKKP